LQRRVFGGAVKYRTLKPAWGFEKV